MFDIKYCPGSCICGLLKSTVPGLGRAGDLCSHAVLLCAVQEVCKDIPMLSHILGVPNHIKEPKQYSQSGYPLTTNRWGDNGTPPSLSLPFSPLLSLLHSLSLTRSLTHTLSHSFSLSFSQSLSIALSLFLSLCVSLLPPLLSLSLLIFILYLLSRSPSLPPPLPPPQLFLSLCYTTSVFLVLFLALHNHDYPPLPSASDTYHLIECGKKQRVFIWIALLSDLSGYVIISSAYGTAWCK